MKAIKYISAALLIVSMAVSVQAQVVRKRKATRKRRLRRLK